MDTQQHLRRQFRFALKADLTRHPTFGAPLGVIVVKPGFGQKQSLIHQRVALGRGIGGKDPHLAVFHLADRATVLPGHPQRVLTFFDKATLVENDHAPRLTPLVGHHAMGSLPHLIFFPDIIADEALHTPDVAPFDMNSHGLNGLALKRTELARHVVKEMLTGFATHKTRVKGLMDLMELIEKSLYIGAGQVKVGPDIWVLLGTTGG
jgi:hypothetical protein